MSQYRNFNGIKILPYRQHDEIIRRMAKFYFRAFAALPKHKPHRVRES